MRCMITASRRASATIAFFIPRRLAICVAQALSHDHFFEWNGTSVAMPRQHDGDYERPKMSSQRFVPEIY